MQKLRIIHLSDLHFGVEHRFAAAPTVTGDRVTQEHNFTLHASLLRDWDGLKSSYVRDNPQVVALTGDLTCRADPVEFDEASQFVTELTRSPVLGKSCTSEQIFVVPGNHDVIWDGKSSAHRIERYLSWYNNLRFTEQILPRDYRRLTRIRQFVEGSASATIVELNSCLYVEKNQPDASRGRIDDNEIHELDRALKQLLVQSLNGSFRILILHHHPILLPEFAEAGRGYDAIENAGPLLALIRRHRFHLVLHGHKHLPRFTEYQAGPGFAPLHEVPWKTLIASGGSLGAMTSQLPTFLSGATNTYTIFELSADDTMAECSVTMELRGLQLYDNQEIRVPESMQWETMSRGRLRIGSIRDTQPVNLGAVSEPRERTNDPLHFVSAATDTASAIRSISASLATVTQRASRSDYFAIALRDTLDAWSARADDLAKGELPLYDSVSTNNVVREMYERARTSVFSTCAQQYLDQWPTRHGQSLLAAHKASSAKVARVFLFKNWREVNELAVSSIAQQAEQGITVYVFIDDDSPFDWPQELTQDFTVIDDGAAIGITTAFLQSFTGEPQTQAKWYFDNTARMGPFRTLIRNLVRESLDYSTFQTRLKVSFNG